VPWHIRQKKQPPTALERKEAELRAADPVFASIMDEVTGPKYAKSLVSGEFLPTEKGFHEEMDRVESNIGRYPIGFRHYENFVNYRLKYPESTIQDYTADGK